MIASARSTWSGTWKEGSGTIATASETLPSTPYTYASRFNGGMGANPEELLAAAHAGCFNQALANNFGMNGLSAEMIDTTVEFHVHQSETGSPSVVRSHITTVVRLPGVSDEIFSRCAERARANCSISRILSCEITLNATLHQ